MKRRVSLAVSLCLMAGLIFQGAQGFPAFAAEKEAVSELEGETDSEAATEEELTELSEAETEAESAVEIETEAETDAAEEMETETESESETEDPMVGELIFAQCEEYINIRAEASTDGEVTAKIYNNGSATVLSVEGEWYEITSGNAHGYVKAEYFATGEEAAAIAEEVAYNVATVKAEFLNIRAEASTDSELIDVAKENDEIEVVLYGEDWMKVALGNDVYGYIKADYVDYATYYPVAETLEEEKARLIAEGLLSEEEAAQTEETDAAETESTEETLEAQTEAVQAETSAETYVETEAEQTDLPAQTAYTEAESTVTENSQSETVAQTEAPQTETAVQTETTAQTEAPQTETTAQTEAPQTETTAQTEAPQTETT
ncbi:MAG: SH3 domain-containing protein, partial [Lachnospiraceae bacterium]|nr:SH3 domain-containing protein [Lachnospiraceae bacterium]